MKIDKVELENLEKSIVHENSNRLIVQMTKKKTIRNNSYIAYANLKRSSNRKNSGFQIKVWIQVQIIIKVEYMIS